MFEDEYNIFNEVDSFKVFMVELCEDEEVVYLKVVEVGYKIFCIYC